MWHRGLLGVTVVVVGAALAGCATIETGFRYEFDGKVYRSDGRTPVKGVDVKIARPDAPEAPELPDKMAKSALKYTDKSTKRKTDGTGRYIGFLQTVKGWKYTEFNGLHTGGPTQAPLPPVLDEVIVYVEDKETGWMGYKLSVPAEAQAEAISGIRKIHIPDLLLPDKPTTAPATAPATAP